MTLDSNLSSPLLSVQDMTVEFGAGDFTVRAVDGLSFDLNANKTLAIVGESGSGKSISSLALLGLLKNIGGKVTTGRLEFQSALLGETVDLAQASEQVMRKIRGNEIAMIFQEPMTSLNPVFSIGSQMAETLALHQNLGKTDARLKALEFLDLVRLPNAKRMLDNYPHQLSGGMRQRVMIAMAICCQPKILIADEPTTALDVTIQAQILHIIRELQAELGTSVVFISHDMGVVSEMADDVLVMKASKYVESGSVRDVLGAPKEDYTKALLAAVPRIGSMKGTQAPMLFDIPGVTTVETDIKPTQAVIDADAPPVLEIEDLTTRYDIRGGLFNKVTHRVHAAENISLKIYPGETLALVGESGSGKSTVGKTIQQLVEPVSGRMRYHGRDIFSLPPAERKAFQKQTQYVFQDPYGSMNPRKTVGESLVEPAWVHGIVTTKAQARDLAVNLLAKVDLPADYATRYPHQFSGGQRQRVCIARALACNPSLVIADEAVSALDVSVQAQVVNLMMKLQADHNLSYLFITHDMAVVERISDRVAVMYLGQIVELGTRQQIFENPQHDYTKRLLSAVPVLDPGNRPNRPPLEGEIPSATRAVGDEPKIVPLRQVSEGHFVGA